MTNPFQQAPRPVQMTVEATADALAILELRMEEVALAITRPLDAVSAHLVLLLDAAQVEATETLARSLDAAARIRVMKLADIDWVVQVQKDFPPFVLGPFYVHGSHARAAVPANRHSLLIDAVAAFGTGEHATTAGCLLALAAIRKRRPAMQSVLDVGCGTAILAIGAARLWKAARIAASDCDPVAVAVSRINLKANRIARRSQAWVSDGYRHRAVRRLGPQPLIVANILARPLMRLARDTARQLAPGGTLILSGLLNSQEAMVLSAHRAQGLFLQRRIRRGKWSVLVLQRAF